MRFESHSPLIITPLQRGDETPGLKVNRFSGFARPGSFSHSVKTAEAVQVARAGHPTPLKRGVNGSGELTAPSYSRFTFHVSRSL
jgi:hypothetical protein